MARILIADDDPDMVQLTKFKLEQSGHEVVTAADGRAALDRCREAQPDIAILDIMMPHMDGLSVCQELQRENATNGDVPRILLLTARGREADVQAGFEAGADDYVIKPFSPRELVSRIDALLHR